MPYAWKDDERISAKEAIEFFEKVKLTFPGSDGAMGVAR